jgi:hypothetical protein
MSLEGTVPLLMHAPTTIDPFADLTKQLKALTSKRKKTADDEQGIYRLEWQAGLYHDAQLGPYIPAENIEKCFRDAAALSKQGKNVQRGVVLEETELPLLYQGPRDIDGLWKAGYQSTRKVRLGGANKSSIMRCRPMFRAWAIEFTAQVDQSILDVETLKEIAHKAGRMIGLGDFRPRYGRFKVAGVDG